MHFPLPWQLILLLFVIFLVFGTSKLPELGRGLGEGIRNFKEALSGEEKKELEGKKEEG